MESPPRSPPHTGRDDGDVEVDVQAVAALLSQAARAVSAPNSARRSHIYDDGGEDGFLPPSPPSEVADVGHSRLSGASAPLSASASSSASASYADRLIAFGRRRDEKREAERARLARERAEREVEGCTFSPVDMPGRLTYRRRPLPGGAPGLSASPSALGGTAAASPLAAAAAPGSSPRQPPSASAATGGGGSAFLMSPRGDDDDRATAVGDPLAATATALSAVPDPYGLGTTAYETDADVALRTAAWDARRAAKVEAAREAAAAAAVADCTFSPRITQRGRGAPSRLPPPVLEALREPLPPGEQQRDGSRGASPSRLDTSAAAAALLAAAQQRYATSAAASLDAAASTPADDSIATPLAASTAVGLPTSAALRQLAEYQSFVTRHEAARARSQAVSAALAPRAPWPSPSSSALRGGVATPGSSTRGSGARERSPRRGGGDGRPDAGALTVDTGVLLSPPARPFVASRTAYDAAVDGAAAGAASGRPYSPPLSAQRAAAITAQLPATGGVSPGAVTRALYAGASAAGHGGGTRQRTSPLRVAPAPAQVTAAALPPPAVTSMRVVSAFPAPGSHAPATSGSGSSRIVSPTRKAAAVSSSGSSSSGSGGGGGSPVKWVVNANSGVVSGGSPAAAPRSSSTGASGASLLTSPLARTSAAYFYQHPLQHQHDTHASPAASSVRSGGGGSSVAGLSVSGGAPSPFGAAQAATPQYTTAVHGRVGPAAAANAVAVPSPVSLTAAAAAAGGAHALSARQLYAVPLAPPPHGGVPLLSPQQLAAAVADGWRR